MFLSSVVVVVVHCCQVFLSIITHNAWCSIVVLCLCVIEELKSPGFGAHPIVVVKPSPGWRLAGFEGETDAVRKRWWRFPFTLPAVRTSSSSPRRILRVIIPAKTLTSTVVCRRYPFSLRFPKRINVIIIIYDGVNSARASSSSSHYEMCIIYIILMMKTGDF